MSQNDFNLANQDFPNMRADMNSALQALASNSSGATAPSVTYPYQWWYDATANILKMRNAGNTAWLNIAAFDQGAGTWVLSGGNDDRYAHRANNLSDLASASTARTNLGLGTAATVNTGTGAGDVPTTAQADARYAALPFASQAQAEAGTDTARPLNALGLRQALRATGSAPVFAARAWANINGTGAVTIRASGNVSSITYGGTGTYTVNFASAMPDANYALMGTTDFGPGGGNKGPYAGLFTTTTAQIFVARDTGALIDASVINVAFFR